MEQKTDDEQAASLLSSQPSEYAVWINMPAPPRLPSGKPGRIELAIDKDGSITGNFGTWLNTHLFNSEPALSTNSHTFHATFKREKMEKCSVRITTSEDRITYVTKETLFEASICVENPHSKYFKLVPSGQMHTFCSDRKVLSFEIMRIQSTDDSKSQILFRRTAEESGWSLINPVHSKYSKEAITQAEEYAKKNSFTEQDLLCRYWVFSNKLLHIFRFKRNSGEMQCNWAPIRSFFQSKVGTPDLFATALEDVRQSLSMALPDFMPQHEQEELKRRFDLKFLHLSNLIRMKALLTFEERQKREEEDKDTLSLLDDSQIIVYDNIKNELHFMDCSNIKSLINEESETIRRVVERWIHFCGIIAFCGETTIKPKDFHRIVRHNWIKHQCLHGQDDEFNIFRSICFAPSSSVVERYQIGFIALTLQILLSIGITVDSVNKWSFEDMQQKKDSFGFDFEQTMMTTISIFTFAFILQRLMRTFESFTQFYSNMREACIIPKAIIALDFTSNIVVGLWITVVTPFFLLQSEDIQTVVLNSFALTFFIELDDMANIFESDEAYLLLVDINGWKKLRPCSASGLIKRPIYTLSCKKSLALLAKFMLGPLYNTFKIFSLLVRMCRHCSKEDEILVLNTPNDE